MSTASKVLCIDLDGTLIRTDSLQEAILCFIKKNPLRLILVLLWLGHGRAYLKQKVAERVRLDPSLLPYNTELLHWITACKQQGQKVVLVTAIDQRYAESVAEHLGIFDEVLASDGQVNLRSQQKASALTQRFGLKGYDYAGNSCHDLPVWREANAAIVVNASPGLLRKAQRESHVSNVFPRKTLSFKGFLKAIRVHQYAKNLLIFLPLLAGHVLGDVGTVMKTMLGFVSFCMMASAVYLLNDLLDVNADRKHPTKSKRAIATGLLSIPRALIWTVGFFAASLGLAWYGLPAAFLGVLGLYAGLTLGYSLWLKQFVLVDVILLSLLYTARVIAGMTLLEKTDYSQWMLLFSLFLFLSLAFLKRVSELTLLKKFGHSQIMGRDYRTIDRQTFTLFGVSSGMMAILVFALYLNSDAAQALYVYPQRLLWVFPFLLYWLCRIWLLATQGRVKDDPVLYAIRDKASYCVGLIILVIFLWAMA